MTDLDLAAIVTTSDEPGCFFCDRDADRHANDCPAFHALGEGVE